MSIFDPLPADLHDEKVVCSYVNATSKIQIARITDVPQWYFERVVFPGQNLIFEAIASAHVEIHTGMMASSILSDTIPCVQLQVEQASCTVSLPSWVPIKSVEETPLESPSVLLSLPEPEVVC